MRFRCVKRRAFSVGGPSVGLPAQKGPVGSRSRLVPAPVGSGSERTGPRFGAGLTPDDGVRVEAWAAATAAAMRAVPHPGPTGTEGAAHVKVEREAAGGTAMVPGEP